MHVSDFAPAAPRCRAYLVALRSALTWIYNHTPPHGTIFVHTRAARPGNYALAISVRSVIDSQKRSVWRGLICKEFVAEEGAYRFFINAPDAPRFKALVELINEYRTRDLGELAKGTVKGQLSGITLKGSVEEAR